MFDQNLINNFLIGGAGLALTFVEEERNPHADAAKRRDETNRNLLLRSAGGALLSFGAAKLAVLLHHPEVATFLGYSTTFFTCFAVGKLANRIFNKD